MTATPQTNTTLEELAYLILDQDNFVICGHISPDGDCLGSQLALAAALQSQGKQVTCVLVKNEPVDTYLHFLPGSQDMVYAGEYAGEVETFIAVDVPNRDRIGVAAKLLDDAKTSITIDHHAMDTTMTDYVYVDPDAASTTILVWDLIGYMGLNRTEELATSCYAGLVSDTGRFQYQNTNARAMNAALEMIQAGANASETARRLYQSRTLASVRLEGRALDRMYMDQQGAWAFSWVSLEDFREVQGQKSDAEPLIDALRSIDSVRVVCMLREQGSTSVRGSFRAKDSTDVAALARKFGGGGHKAAAGFTLTCSLEEGIVLIKNTLTSVFCDNNTRDKAEGAR